MRESRTTDAALVWKFYFLSVSVQDRAQRPRLSRLRTWMIWSNFLMESAVGPVLGWTSAVVVAVGEPASAVSCPEAPDPDRARAPRRPSLGLFVREGFVWGEEAGDETRGAGRACWCILLGFCSLIWPG